MKYPRKRGSTSNMLRVFIQDNTATDGTGLTGLVFNSTNLQIAVIREFSASPTIYTGANIEDISTIGTFQAPSVSSKCRFKAVDGTNMPGVYEVHFHDDAGHFGAGDASKNLQMYVFEITTTALNIATLPVEVQLTAIDVEDSVYNMYAGGVWVDDAAGNTNTVVGTDGLPSNPVSTLAAARTIADAIGIKKYYIVNDSTFTLGATHLNWEVVGIGLRNQLDLGSQIVNDSYFKHIVLSGTQGGTQKIEAECCYLNGIVDMNIIATNCWLTGNNTLAVSTLNILDHCSSNVPGGSTPELTFQAGVSSIGIRHYSGGLTVKSMTADHTMSYEADGQLIIDASCVSGNISARGNIKITDNGTTTNLTNEAVYNQTIVNSQMDIALADYGALTKAELLAYLLALLNPTC